MDISKLVPLYEQIILEYSEGFLKQQVTRLQRQNIHITPETIKQMLQRFDQLKTPSNTRQEIKRIIETDIKDGTIKATESPKDIKRVESLKKAPWNVEFYNLNELEKVVHSFRGVNDKQAEKDAVNIGATDYGAELVYETPDHMLQIFFAKDAQAANSFKLWLIKVKQKEIKDSKLQVTTGTGRGLYGWCVSAPLDRGNLFASYRFCSHDENKVASLYFVLDNKLPVTDNKHVVVVHAYKNNDYLVTGANNDGDQPFNWQQLVNYNPELKNLKKIFKFQPYTDQEQLYLLTRGATPEDFAGYTPKIKKAYIELGPQKKIFSRDYINLSVVDPNLSYVERQEAEKMGADLQHAYINVRSPNANDTNFLDRLMRLLNLFEDSDYSSINARIQQAQQLRQQSTDENDLSWEEPLFQDEALLRTKDKSVLKYWRKLIHDCLYNLGAAQRADAGKQQ